MSKTNVYNKGDRIEKVMIIGFKPDRKIVGRVALEKYAGKLTPRKSAKGKVVFFTYKGDKKDFPVGKFVEVNITREYTTALHGTAIEN